MKPTTDYLVPWLQTSEPYSARHMDEAWENPDILRMMSNENLVPPGDKVTQAILQAARSGNYYPGSGVDLREKLAKKAGLQAGNVVLGNGSTDLIDIVIRSFVAPGEEVILPDPTFAMYEARVRVNGGRPVKIPAHTHYDFNIRLMLNSVTPRTKLMFICSPNNPSGTLTSREDLIQVLETGLPTFFDEAYYELMEHPKTNADLLLQYPNLMVNRTFSKAFGVAGLRLGYLFCSEELAGFLNRMKIPWNVSLLTLAGALAQLDDESDLEHKRQVVIHGREYIRKELNSLPGIWAYPSEGNFILIDADSLGLSGAEIRARMIEKGIFIRPVYGYYLGKGFFRVTVGQTEQNEKFIKAFRELYQEVKGSALK